MRPSDVRVGTLWYGPWIGEVSMVFGFVDPWTVSVVRASVVEDDGWPEEEDYLADVPLCDLGAPCQGIQAEADALLHIARENLAEFVDSAEIHRLLGPPIGLCA